MRKKTLLTFAGALVLGTTVLFAETTAPKLMHGKMPAYPDVARSEGLEGTVVVEALVDEHGRVFAADVVKSPDESLEAVTLAAIEKWQFEPAKVDGKPTMQVVRIPIHFNLIDPMGETVLRAHDRAIASR